MSKYIYMLYRIKHHDSGLWFGEPIHVPSDTIFFFSYVSALRTLVKIRKKYREKGYQMKFAKSPNHPKRVQTATSYTYMCTYIVNPFPYSGTWSEYIILKCPIYEHEFGE